MRSIPSVEVYRFPDEDCWPQMIDPVSGDKVRVPPFSTLQQALVRGELERTEGLREIRFTAAWGNEWPLWETTYGPRSPGDLQLSADLALKLKRWSEAWYKAAEHALQQGIDVGLVLPCQWFSEGEALTRELAIDVWSTCNVFPFFRRYLPPAKG